MLNIKDLSTSYGSIKAIKGIDIDVPEGSIVSLIGANGAGKTTTMKSLVGLLKPQAGQIKFQGREIRGFAPHKIVNLGMSLVPEGRHILAGMTVLENLEMGAYQRKDKGVQEDFQTFSDLRGTQATIRRNTVWRSATNAGHRPRTHG